MCDHDEYEFMECKDGTEFWKCKHCPNIRIQLIDCTGG